MIQAHKTRLNPTPEQEVQLERQQKHLAERVAAGRRLKRLPRQWLRRD